MEVRVRLFLILALVAAALAGACKDTREPASCESQAAELGRWLKEIEAAGGAPVMLGQGLRLVERDGPALRRYALILEIDASGARLNGQPIASDDMLAEIASDQRDAAAALGDPSRLELLVAIDREAPWRVVAPELRRAAAGWPRAKLLFARPVKLQPPPPSSVTKDLEALASYDPSMKAARLAQITMEVFSRCGGIEDLFTRIAMAPPDVRSGMLVKGLPEALVACKCQADLAAVRTIGWALFGPGAGTSASTVEIALADGPGAPAVEVAADATWATAHEAVVAAARGGKALRF